MEKMSVSKNEKEAELDEGSGDEWSWSIRDYKDSKTSFPACSWCDLELWAQQKERDNSTGYKMEKEWHSEKKIWILYLSSSVFFSKVITLTLHHDLAR